MDSRDAPNLDVLVLQPLVQETGHRMLREKGIEIIAADERALVRAGAAKVCQMVHDWFAAQLAIKDSFPIDRRRGPEPRGQVRSYSVAVTCHQ